MKKLIYFFVLAFVISSCSKKTVDPDPSEQVLGTYKVTTYTESTNGVGLTYDLTSASLKDLLQITFEVSKKGASVITVGLTFTQKDAQGKTQVSKDSFDNVDLKNGVNGEFEMFEGAKKIGKIGNGSLVLEDEYDDKDSNGKAIKVKDTFVAKKS